MDPNANDRAARLIKQEDPLGREVNISYKSWTTAQIAESPDRQWQIDTIADEANNTLTFSYDSTQHSGRWVVNSVVRSDSVSVTFQYNTDALTSVTLPGGTQSTFSYGQDTVSQTATITIREAAKDARELTYHLTNDYMTLSNAGRAQVTSS